MTGHFRLAALFLAASIVQGPAQAQETAYSRPAFQLGETYGDSIIRETRNGGQLVGAEIDMCFQHEVNGKWDRIVLPLKVEGERLSGTGTSEILKLPVEFNLVRKRVKSLSSFSGLVRVANDISNVEQNDLSDRTREDLTESQETTALVEDPADFTVVQPNVIAVRVKRGELKGVLASLRGEELVLDTNYGLIEDCSALRKGFHIIQFMTPPDNAQSLVEKIRKVRGVLAAGWSGYSALNYAVRIPAKTWSANGKLDRERIVDALSKSIARTLGASFLSSRWDAGTGQLVLEMKRPSKRFQDAGFSEAVTARILLSPERFGSSEFFLVSMLTVTANLLDDVSGPRLQIPPFHEVGGEGYVDPEPAVMTIAKDFNGVTWDGSAEKWNNAN